MRCALCGQTSEQKFLVSADQAGPMDLDTRPSEALRSTLSAWVQECPHCGYCAEEVSRAHDGAAARVAGAEYQAQLRSADDPPLARRFLCLSLLEEGAGNLRQAAWRSLHAAWACDDAAALDAARRCRQRAAACIQAGLALSQPLADQAGATDAILADVYRRAGRLEEARMACERGLESTAEAMLRNAFHFQLQRIAQGDTASYTLAHVAGRG
jgi:hypothetical protein